MRYSIVVVRNKIKSSCPDLYVGSMGSQYYIKEISTNKLICKGTARECCYFLDGYIHLKPSNYNYEKLKAQKDNVLNEIANKVQEIINSYKV